MKPVCRNRTPQYTKSRKISVAKKASSSRPRNGASHGGTPLMPQEIELQAAGRGPTWVENVATTKQLLRTLEGSCQALQAAQEARLAKIYNGNEVTTSVDEATMNCQRQIQQCEGLIRAIKSYEPESPKEAKIQANVVRDLALRTQVASSKLRNAQRHYLEQLQQRSGLDDDVAGDEDDPGFSERQLTEVERAEVVVAFRAREIEKVANSMQQLNGVFKELASLVIDAGTVLDRIDYNLERVADHTSSAVVELGEAERAVRSRRPLVCIAILVAVLMLQFFYLMWHWGAFSSNDQQDSSLNTTATAQI